VTFPIRRSLILFVAFAYIPNARAQGTSYTYVWSPRRTDVGKPGSKDYAVLRAILSLCATVPYTPQSAEGLDFVIRTNFLVSSTPFPNAYSLYGRRIRELNADRLKNGIVQKGQTVLLPSGPKFGASDLSDLNLDPNAFSSAFMAMSQAAYHVEQNVNRHVEDHAVATLRYYVSATGAGSENKLFGKIKSRGLVYAPPANAGIKNGIQITKTLPSILEPLQLKAVDAAQRAQLNIIGENDPSRMLPAQIYLTTSQPRLCQNPCTDCTHWMSIPPNLDFSKVRVLVVDTGIKSGYIDSAHLIKLSQSDTGADVSQDSHGTFVYSEIAKPPSGSATPQELFGSIPQDKIYVAGAATKQGVTVFFNSSDIVQAWNNFDAMNAGVSNIASTQIVNLSVFGGQVLNKSKSAASFLAIPDGMLIIAAAGNQGTQDDPKLHAFASYSNGNVPLIIVGALGTDGKVASYSDWNTEYVQLFAPGDCVCGSPSQIDGTSQATPFVTTAAAAVAATNPSWTPIWVMWRLLSTADHPSYLQSKAFAGEVNLTRALVNRIYLEEKSANGNTTMHQATAITYDKGWKDAFAETGSNQHNNETLRLYPNSTTRADGAICFTTLNFLSYNTQPTCVQPDAKVQLTENGALTSSIPASQINDLILPMPPINGAEPNLPNVTVSGSH